MPDKQLNLKKLNKFHSKANQSSKESVSKKSATFMYVINSEGQSVKQQASQSQSMASIAFIDVVPVDDNLSKFVTFGKKTGRDGQTEPNDSVL